MKIKTNKGFSLVEVIVAATVFAVVAMAIYQGFISITNLVALSREKIVAVDLINSEFELVRNLSYANVGLQTGIPHGVLLATSTVSKDGKTFDVVRTIRNIDDPFDGTIGGSPNDLSPADYKMIQIKISCENCKNPVNLEAVSNIAPKNLETASANGAIFVKVFDANGNPVPQAEVHVQAVGLGINIDETTNNDGLLALVDVPPANNAYSISVSKNGFTIDRTYPVSVGNPHPTKPDATVLLQQLTQVSFVIDKVSIINVRSKDLQCGPVTDVPFTLSGAKLIGTDPDVLKFSGNYSTGASGVKTLNSMEWDLFTLVVGGGLNLAGVNPPSPFSILPDSTQNVDIIVAEGAPQNLLVTVRDNVTGLPLSGVKLTLTQGSFSEVKVTGQGYLGQTDWSGGGGQGDFVDETKYWNLIGSIDVNSPAGEIKLKKVFSDYLPFGMLTSSVFDTGTSSNFSNIIWAPTDQPPQTGTNSVKLQFASSPDNTGATTWNYLGPDGTGSTSYTLVNNNINSIHNGDRYFRYIVFLSTENTKKTPNVSDVAIVYTSECIPPGQALFSGHSSGNHDLMLEKNGYQTKTLDVNLILGNDWKSIETTMSPE
jgi:prepilin-type N-terminal cleavage/methylation domain-containing protein